MSNGRDDDAISSPKATPATADEIAEYEKSVRNLIRRKAPFDKHMAALHEMLGEREQADETPSR